MSLCPTCHSPVRRITEPDGSDEYQPLADGLLAQAWQSLINVHEEVCGCTTPGDPSTCKGEPPEAFVVLIE